MRTSYKSMTANWFKRQRLDWIMEMLRIYGFVNRQHLERKFGVSVPQASNDLRDFSALYPKVMFYNVNRKRYEAVDEA